MRGKKTSRNYQIQVGRIALIIIAAWTAIVGGLLCWIIAWERGNMHELVQAEARVHFNRDMAFRQWVASHGGLYVPVDKNTPPNPYLSHVQYRDITKPDGTEMTLMNPAYSARQMNKTFSNLCGVSGHITSLKPLRPENAPDDWERMALKAFERGETEVNEFTEINGEPCFRLMQPMIAEQSCLRCHGHQGYKEGDIRGGVSISLPMALLLAREGKQELCEIAAFGIVWLLGLVGICCGARAITKRKQIEEEIRQSEERFRDVATSMFDWVWECDIQGRYTYCSAQALDILGYKPEEMLGKTPFDMMLVEEAARVGKIFNKIAADKSPIKDLENRNVTKDGREIFLLTNGVPVLDEEGNLLGYRGVDKDITERKHAELELAKAKNESEAANVAKSEFLANMSHEIRTPMTAILGFADILAGSVVDKEHLDAAVTIKKNGEYLLGIINDILDLSKIEAGKLDVEHIQCSPSQVLSEVASLMRVRASAKNLPLEIEYDGPIPQSIQSDPTRLRQMLINLTGNAVKFTEVGKIRLVARLLDAGSEKPMMQFDVIDTGIGMTEEQIANLFKPFHQADSSTTRKFGGTGLGLTISKRFAGKLGGDITVRSTPGEGSTFTVTIETGPLDDVEWHENLTEAQPTTGTDRKSTTKVAKLDCRILLAEDGPDNQRLISFLLKKAGAEVAVADNGQIAYDLALAAQNEGNPFDVILMDMQMPVMDGYEATSALREAGYTGSIVAITAHAMSTDRQKCRAAGCDDYLTKPVDRKKLISTVAQYASQEEYCKTDFVLGE